MVVQSLPPGQFTVAAARTVRNKLMCIHAGAVHRYGLGGFRWVCAVGDLLMSAMYDEVDHIFTTLSLRSLAYRNGHAGGSASG